ncbi:MAG: bile acid:sodium symporter family protein [Gammaproteobacteria bacterium]
MPGQQAVLGAVLALMVFAVALELRFADFLRVARAPRAVAIGLVPQFLLLPLATWCVTRVLPLPANVETAMMLVAACPGGSLSNVVTHFGGGNTALSVSLSATASLLALLLTPLNFAWMVAANPATAGWVRELQLDPSGLWWSLLALLGLPMACGLLLAHHRPGLADRWRRPLARLSLVALFAFIAVGLFQQRALLVAALLPLFGVVVAHNALGLALGAGFAALCGLPDRDRRAVTIEAGMQNSGLALGIIALQFRADLGMVVVASLWGMWHIVSGLALAGWWRSRDARPQD